MSDSELAEALSQVARIMKHDRLRNYIIPGLESYLIGGGEFGKVRFFQMTRNAVDWITPHSHRFDFLSVVLRGKVHNTLFKKADPAHSMYREEADEWCVSTIGQVCGPDGILSYQHKRETVATLFRQHTRQYEPGEFYGMNYKEIHSVRFSEDAEVMIFEGPQRIDHSVMLEPWVNGQVVPTFKTEDWMFLKDQP